MGADTLIEVSLAGVDERQLDESFNAMRQLTPTARRIDDYIVMDSDAQGALMRPVRVSLGRMGIVPSQIRMRRRSLEDVFVDLTGMRLG
jgi:hypothetical protein